MKHIALAFIRAYQRLVAPFLPQACRFEPSCSHYGYEAISRYGTLRGGWLAVKRVGRCQPLCSGGYDPVPDLPSQR